MKKIFTVIIAVSGLVLSVQSQTLLTGVRKPIQLNYEKAPGDTIVEYPPAVDTCQSTDIYIVDAFGTYTLPIPGSPMDVTAVGQKMETQLSEVLAVGAYIQLVGTGNTSPYAVSINTDGTSPGSALGTSSSFTVIDTLDAANNIYYAFALFASPVSLSSSDFYVTGTVTPTAAGDTIRYLLYDCASATSFLQAGTTWLSAATGGIEYDVAFEVFGIEASASIEESNISVSNIMPNPASDYTMLVYNIKESSSVSVKLIDLTGQVVKQINEGSKAAGTYSVKIDLDDVAAGTYIYQMNANGYTSTGRVIVSK